MHVSNNRVSDPEFLGTDGEPARPPDNNSSNRGADGITPLDGAQFALGAVLGGLFGSAFGPGGTAVGAVVGGFIVDNVD